MKRKECGGMSVEIEQAFGIVLKKVRAENSLSQEKLAHICDLDRTYISLLERGKRKPTISTIFALALGLSVKPSDLVGATEKLLSHE